ncbi:MAG: TIGR00730 family Rossman fold protein [Bacteroidales bacterium]|nr:TIGR00730 family Rossman fold protein [Bacteroidales bacterium]
MSTEKDKLEKAIQEILDSNKILEKIGKSVCVFGSSSIEEGTEYYQQAVETGYQLAQAGFAVITGGGPGLMEAVNKGVQKAKGKSIGICMEFPEICIENEYIDKENHLLLSDFSARKYLFWKFANAFVALPGGLGTLDEITECLTLMQMKNIQQRPLILQDKKFWSGMAQWLENTLKNEYKTIRESDINLFEVTDNVNDTITKITNNIK